MACRYVFFCYKKLNHKVDVHYLVLSLLDNCCMMNDSFSFGNKDSLGIKSGIFHLNIY